ncbi:MAG: hypothetical protein ABL982_09505 [Vicinamibacterales bacterium]
MKPQDEARLREPYPGENRLSPEDSWPRALGVDLAGLRTLYAAIESDLDRSTFGVRWWHDHLDPRRRILISDYLHQTVRSIQINLVEARLHQLEIEELADSSGARTRLIADAHNRPIVAHVPAKCALDDLHVPLLDMHVAGFFRSIGSALDCVAGATIGVTGLSVGILKSDFGSLRKELDRLEARGDPGSLVKTLRDRWPLALAVSDDVAWLDWTLAFRNTLVHRARRMIYTTLRPTSIVWIGPESPVAQTEALHMLPSQPHMSEIDSFRDANSAPVLTEDLATTVRNISDRCIALADQGTLLLHEVWMSRRADPGRIRQPAAQWSKPMRPAPSTFEGFWPGSLKYNPGAFFSDPSTRRRIEAAALTDAHRHLWDSWADSD